MAPLTIKGVTLGVRHRNYNKLINEAIQNNSTPHIKAINYEEPDLDNIYKIDVACNRRNVKYILDVLKCEDMLYVSRVLKGSTWMITDQQFVSIINPEYLHLSLCPQMTSKAFSKLLLHIRLHLKDETRVEDFFNYYKESDLQTAMKWLPGCSIPFIENIIQKHADDIPERILKRLYKKSITFLGIFITSYKSYSKRERILPAMFHLKKNSEKFIDIIESTSMEDIPGFGPKYTTRVMKKHPERIMKNLEKYVDKLEPATFAKFIKKEDVKNFILTNIKNEKMRPWFKYSKIKYFLNRLPVEERFDFINNYFIEKSIKVQNLKKDVNWDNIIKHCSPPSRNILGSKTIYSWYVYVPFNKAFGDLKHMIRNESNPNERLFIFQVLLTCAGSDMKNILVLLKYYREHHMNEPFKFKIKFVNQLLSKTDTHKYDKEAWGYLKDIFNSMEVYTKSDKNIQSCVKAIILRHVINEENIPEIIEEKFDYENLDNKSKFNVVEREKIFNYLYKYLITKFKDQYVYSSYTEKKFDETYEVVVKVLKLLKESNKDLNDYPLILQKIKDLILVKKENGWERDISVIYHIKKSWRKLLFTESILLSLTEETCINALKHDLQLLKIYEDEIKKLYIDDNVLLERFLKKIRIYYHQSLANTFKQSFLENLNQINNNGALMKGLCVLLSRKEVIDFTHKNKPTELKIIWSQTNDAELCLRKLIAKCMHLARPHPPLTSALEYAKGDYLQYILPSLNAILYNISANYTREHLTEVLNTHISLQKHGVRVAFMKLKYAELKTIFLGIWKSSKNSTIRNDIFCQTFQMLCKEKNTSTVAEIWELLSLFIDELTFDENNKIYVTLSKADKVPMSVKPAFVMKNYDFLKTLPAKAYSSSLIYRLKSQMHDIYEFLETDFMNEIFFENFVENFTTGEYKNIDALARYLLSAKNKTAEIERYEKVFLPFIEQTLTVWDVQHKNIYYARYNLCQIFSQMSDVFAEVVLHKKMIFPIAMYTAALNTIQNTLPEKQNYYLLTYIKLSLGYIQIVQNLRMNIEIVPCDSKDSVVIDEKDKWENLHNMAAPSFGKLCLDYLKEDVTKHFSLIYIVFEDILDDLYYNYIGLRQMSMLRILKVFVDNKDFIEGQLFVLKIMPSCLDTDDEKALRLEIINEIGTHPSEKVMLHYWNFRKEYYNL